MNRFFKNLMGDATRLIHVGDLRGATAAIQAALGGSPQAPSADRFTKHAWTIDVQAREVPDSAPRYASGASFDTLRHPAPPPMKSYARPTLEPDVHSRSTLDRQGRFIEGRHAETGRSLAYKLYVPPQAGVGPLPLIVMLHGCTQNPDDFAAGTGMNDAALEHGFFVLYPAQAQDANPQRCWNWFKHNHQVRDQGEPAVLAGMTRSIMRQHHIDPRRVYVAGLSAGGAMAAILGDAYPDLFAAIGVHSGLATGAATDITGAFAAMQGGTSMAMPQALSHLPGMAAQHKPKRPASPGTALPTIVFHGDADATVHPINGEHIVAACMPSGCVKKEQARSSQGRSYTRGVHQHADGRTASEHWVIHGAGHAWSGGRSEGSYTDPSGPDATREMLRFFLDHPKSSVH